VTDLTLVELFSGIGGFSCAFERAGVQTVAAVEIDSAARTVFKSHFPDAFLFDDVTKVSGDDIRATGFNPQRGILTGGWPCQDISNAGKQKGLAGGRSGLFSEVVRLLGELKPRWFVLENVPNLLTINGGRDMGTVIGALVGCGYGVSYRVLDAQFFGIPQRRRRIFFVGHLGDTGSASAEVLFESEGGVRNFTQGSKPEPLSARGFGVGPENSGGELSARTIISTLQGGGKRGYRIDAEGAAGGHLIVSRSDLGVRRLTPLECERLQGFPDGWTGGESDSGRYRMLGNAVAVPVVQWIANRIVEIDGGI